MPMPPIPAQPSRKIAPSTLPPRILNTVSFSLSLVGRIPAGGVALSRRLLNFPEITRTLDARFSPILPADGGQTNHRLVERVNSKNVKNPCAWPTSLDRLGPKITVTKREDSIMKRMANLVLFCLLITGTVYAQSVQGTVSDATGAVLPGATINVKNSGTDATVELTSDERGRYLAPVLQPGEYEIQVSLPGFQSVFRRGVRLAVGQNAVVDIKL